LPFADSRVCFQGCPKQFVSLSSLLVHHSVMAEALPCPLDFSRLNESELARIWWLHSLALFRYEPRTRSSTPAREVEGENEDIADEYLDDVKDGDAVEGLRRALLARDGEEEGRRE